MRLLMLPTRERFGSTVGSSGPGLSGRFDGGELCIAGYFVIECGDVCGGAPRLSGGDRMGTLALKPRGSLGPPR